jgi:hypothetical protein
VNKVVEGKDMAYTVYIPRLHLRFYRSAGEVFELNLSAQRDAVNGYPTNLTAQIEFDVQEVAA